MTKARLEPSRMTERALHDRALSLAVQLSSYGFTSLTSSEVRAMGRELQSVLTELRLRGVQLQLAL